MKSNVLRKKMLVLVFAMLVSMFGSTLAVFAKQGEQAESNAAGGKDWNSVISDIKTEADKDKDTGIAGLAGEVKSAGGELYGVLRIVGIVAAIVAFAIAGITLIFGNPQERSQTKQKILFIAAGILLIFGAGAIVLSFIDFANGLAG